MTIQEIKRRNRLAGYHFFDANTMRFFNSEVISQTYTDKDGKMVYFVTSEQFVPSSGKPWPRKYTVRQFNTETADINTIQPFNDLTEDEAIASAEWMAKT